MSDEWKNIEKELPPCDGYYLCAKSIMDSNPRMAYYDGYGFMVDGIYRDPGIWKPLKPMLRKYGLQNGLD